MKKADDIMTVDEFEVGKTYDLNQKVEIWLPIYGFDEDVEPTAERLHMITTVGAMVSYECPLCGDG